MRATNLLPQITHTPAPAPAPAAVTMRLVAPPVDEALKRRRQHQRERLKALYSDRAARMAAEVVERPAVAPEASEPPLRHDEPGGLREPRIWPRENLAFVTTLAREAEYIAKQREPMLVEMRRRLEDQTRFVEIVALAKAMQAAFEACGVTDKGIFDRYATGTYDRNPESVSQRRAVFAHMHDVSGVSWVDIARLFGVSHSVVMACRRPSRGIAEKSAQAVDGTSR